MSRGVYSPVAMRLKLVVRASMNAHKHFALQRLADKGRIAAARMHITNIEADRRVRVNQRYRHRRAQRKVHCLLCDVARLGTQRM